MTSPWQPYRERLRVTILRTGTIAIVVGAMLARLWGDIALWPVATLVALWPSFGGHWVEVWFLNCLRPRLSETRGLQAAARLGVWFAGGSGLALGMSLTARALAGFRTAYWPTWWAGGLAFIGVELVAHLALRLRGHPNFYDGRG